MARKPKKSEETKADAAKAEEVLTSTDADLNAEQITNSDADSVNGDQVGHSQCGGQLSAARLAQGFSTNDVAKQLRLSQTQIEALEADRFSQLPEATIVKGFIRNYAKILKIPSAPLLVAYVEMVPEKENYSFVLDPGINMKITEHQQSHKARYFLFAASLLLAAGAWIFYQNYIQKPSPVNPIPEIIDALPELALPLSERTVKSSATSESLDILLPAVEPNSTGSTSSDTQDSDKPEGELLDNTQLEEEDVTEDVSETAADVIEATPPALGKTRLKFSATQETWLSVINASGKEVYNKILYAGNQEVVDIWQPSMIVVGNAHGASLIVDGKPIDLAPYTRVNVARVRLNR